MTKLLTSTWMTIVLSAVIYCGTTIALWKSPTPADAALEGASPAVKKNGASWEFTNPEADQLMSEIRAEKKSLEKREQELNDLAVRLDAEKTELGAATQSVQAMQTNFDQQVIRIKEEETANLKKLGKVYAGMSPESAATIFTEMDDASIVKIMVYMKDGENAGILEAFAKKGQPEAKRAAELSERLRMTSFRNPTTK